MPCLRIGTGLGLTIVAFTEKLANPELARVFLQHHPLNFTAWLHIPMSDDIFVLCAGSTELLIGLCLIFGIFPRLIVASAWVLINMSLTVFNWVELVGHLPLYGVMAMLLVWTPARKNSGCGRRCPREMSRVLRRRRKRRTMRYRGPPALTVVPLGHPWPADRRETSLRAIDSTTSRRRMPFRVKPWTSLFVRVFGVPYTVDWLDFETAGAIRATCPRWAGPRTRTRIPASGRGATP